MSEIHIIYTARQDATPESERQALARVYAFVLQTYQEQQKVSAPGRPEDAESSPGGPGSAPDVPRAIATP